MCGIDLRQYLGEWSCVLVEGSCEGVVQPEPLEGRAIGEHERPMAIEERKAVSECLGD